jgi:xanthosine utilization system XapX-like protein
MKKVLLSAVSGFALGILYSKNPTDKKIEDMPSWPV